MKLLPYGLTQDDRTARLVRLGWQGGLEVEVLGFGAVVRSLRIPAPRGERRNIVVALGDIAAGYRLSAT